MYGCVYVTIFPSRFNCHIFRHVGEHELFALIVNEFHVSAHVLNIHIQMHTLIHLGINAHSYFL